MSGSLQAYRRIQRELRREFDSFTAVNCPACPTPCCRKPARILPTDILLAQSAGWRAEGLAAASDPVADAALQAAASLSGAPMEESAPCDHLGAHGCAFPADLRPYGCAAYICRYMEERLDRKTLSRIRRHVRELTRRHTELLQTLREVTWRRRDPEDDEKAR